MRAGILKRASRHSDAFGLPNRRGEQPLVWLHSATPSRLPALGDIAKRLKQQRDDVYIVASTLDQVETRPPIGVDYLTHIPSDAPSDAARRVTEWVPSAAIWAGAGFPPKHVKRLQNTAALSILCDVGLEEVPLPRYRWVPDPARMAFAAFDAIYANDDATCTALSGLSLTGVDILSGSALDRSAVPPTCSEEDVTELKAAIGGRASWLAAQVSRDEIDIVLKAHRAALRLQHRLLLILVPADPVDLPAIRKVTTENNLRCADWDNGELPADLTQVILSAEEEDLGIWYRIATLTLMGGTFDPRPDTPHPMHPAALGSAILSGPMARSHVDALDRLSQAGGALQISDPDRLGDAVLSQIAPHHAAEMALAAWGVATDGAGLIDQLVDHVVDHLDRTGGDVARS